MTSLDTNWDPAERWADDLPRAVTALTATGLGLVVKRGALGALCAAGARVGEGAVGAQPAPVAAPLLPEGDVVDTTGAGDCFNAGLIAGLLRGLDLPAAARLGCAVATLSTRAAGGTAAAPGLAEALQLAAAG